MKKLLISLLLILITFSVFSNVYIPTAPVINELKFDENGHWYLEILYELEYDEFTVFDSIIISTSTTHYKLRLPHFETYQKEIYVLSDTLIGDSLTINPQGDSIHIEGFGEYTDLFNYNSTNLIFGDYKNSTIDAPGTDKSICLFCDQQFFYTISIAPTIGDFNSALGTLGWIKGKVYDDQVLLSKKYSFEWYFNFYTSTTGEFITTLKPGDYQLSRIGYYYSDGAYKSLEIDPITISLGINDTIEADIHITDDFFVGISKNETKPFILYPNPASNTLNIKGDYNKSIHYIILDVNGNSVLQGTDNFNQQLQINLPENISAGIYILQLVNDDKIVYTQNFLVNPF